VAPVIASVILAALAAVNLYAQASKSSEYQVKAAYLYSFGRFVAWPSAPAKQNEFAICVLGRDPFGPTLETVGAGITIGGQPAVSRRLERAQDATGCRVLFISASEESALGRVFAALGKSTVLTVSDLPDFTRRGGVIQFVVDGNRVRFEVNLTAADEAGLVLSSELLKVAIAVRRIARPGA
jgi:hypothetical protein